MKKKLLGGLLVVAIAAVVAFNVNMNTGKNELSALALANVEALAGGEAFNGWFDGTNWNTHESNWFGSDWTPYLRYCTGSDNWSIGGQIGNQWGNAGGTTGGGSSWSGRMIVCGNGNGNCFNGTSCRPE